MRYNVKAIPTKYNGVNFRSKLEATWAAFFDSVGIKWEYEPMEFDGWFPDFRLFKKGEPLDLLVEVKPDYFDNMVSVHKVNKESRKNFEGKILFLGQRPSQNISLTQDNAIGIISRPPGDFETSDGYKFHYAFLEKATSGTDIMSENMLNLGQTIVGEHKSFSRQEIDFFWNAAKNETQYKNKRWK